MQNITVTGYAAEGKSLARVDGKVIFIEGAVPGDVVDVRISKNKKDWAEGKATIIKEFSKVYKYTVSESLKKETIELLTLIYRANSRHQKSE